MIRNFRSADFLALESMADRYLVPLYGDQRKAIAPWDSGDKPVFVAVNDTTSVVEGFLALTDKPDKSY